MNQVKVAQVFGLMGKLSMDEVLPLMPVVDLSIQDVTARLRDQTDLETHEELLTYVCAAHAYYRYSLIEAAASPAGSFSACGISVNNQTGTLVEQARRLRDEFWSAAQFLLKDSEEFFFARTQEESR